MKGHTGSWLITIIVLLMFATVCPAAEWNVASETIFGTFQRDTPQGEDQHVMPAYEYLSIDYGDDDSGGIAFHGYGWVRKDLSDSEFYTDDPDGELLSAYLTYARPYSPYQVSLGRQHIFAGVANESVDGLRFDADLGSYLSVCAYGGVPVQLGDTDGRSGDTMYGGRAALLFAPAAQLGISYKHLQDNGEKYEQTVGADISWSPVAFLALDGRSAYNLETKGWREHNYSAQIVAGPVEVAPVYQYFQYSDYFSTAENRNNLFRHLFDSDEQLTDWGADATWYASQILKIGVRGRHYDYAVRETTAQFWSGLVTVDVTPEISLGGEAGQMDGQTPEDSYQLYRAYCVWAPGNLLGPDGQLSADVLYQAFDEAIFGVDSALFVSLSAGRRFFSDKLLVKASLNYSQDPFFDDDVSGLVTFLINF